MEKRRGHGLHVPSNLVEYLSARDRTWKNRRTGFIIFDPLLELERVKFHVHPG
jgi:hypothetical protein